MQTLSIAILNDIIICSPTIGVVNQCNCHIRLLFIINAPAFAQAVVSCTIIACNYFRIWAGLSLSISVCVTVCVISLQKCRPTKNNTVIISRCISSDHFI